MWKIVIGYVKLLRQNNNQALSSRFRHQLVDCSLVYCLLNKITITGLLAQFNAAHNKEESILCMATDKRNEYLFTGEIFKYLKLVKVRVLFANCRRYRKILCCSYGRSDKFYMSLALFQISI